jgi:hypothetical protein
VYVLASLDESTDLPFGDPLIEIGEPSPAGNVGAGVDFERETALTRIRGSLFGLARSPFEGRDRGYFGAGRIEGSRRLGRIGRLAFTDEAKMQGRPQLDVSNYWRNAATVRAEWNRASGGGFDLQIADRRRTLSDIDVLSFSRQSAGGDAFFRLGEHGRAQLGVDLQHYSALTAAGERLRFGGELARFTRNGTATVRVAWFEPLGDRRREHTFGGGEFEFGDIGRGEFFEALVLEAGVGVFASDMFFFDPLESDSDEWDFGRRKQLVSGFFSHRFGRRNSVTAFVRFQHKHGPNLLLPADAAGAGPFTDDRLATRAAWSFEVRRHITLLLQGSQVENWSDRPLLAFTRVLLAGGVQFRF